MKGTPQESLNGQAIVLKRGMRAVWFIHGFTSTTQSLMPVAQTLAEAGWTVAMPLLPGHGTTPEDMAKHTAEDWLDAAISGYDQLAREYPSPAVAGLSMGGALALHVAAHRPVPAVVALAPALYLRDTRLWFLPLLKYIVPWRRSLGNDVKGDRFQEQTYHRYHLKNIEDLLRVMKTVRAELAQVNAPLLGIQSQEDHTVPPSCLDDLMRWAGSFRKESHRLYDSYHVITLDNEYSQVAAWMLAFLNRHTSSAK